MSARRRRRRNIRRIRQRNRRVALVIILSCFICIMAMINLEKERSVSQEAYARQQEKTEEAKKSSDEDSGTQNNLQLASEEEKKQWYLKLVNAENPMTQEDIPEVAEETVDEEGYQVDKRIVQDLEDMFEAARAEGLNPMICSAFRAWDTQVSLYENKVSRVIEEEGLNEEDAAVKAATVVARPGTSEHQIGLAVDIVSHDYQELDEEQMNTPEQKWLMENCWKYGFILRYPVNKSQITGVIFEPWHYRYVGKEAAKEISEQELTLEEYLGAQAVDTPVFDSPDQEL